MSIKKIGFQNFRVFKDMQEIELAPITVLTGKNNSGKSSIIKALMLLTENAKENSLKKLDFHLGEKRHNLYNFENILNDVNKDFIFSFTVNAIDADAFERIKPKDKEFEIKYVFKKSELERITLTEIFENKKNHKIIDYIDQPFVMADLNWFYRRAKNRSVYALGLESEDSRKCRDLKEYLESFPRILGSDFFKSKLKNFPEKDVNNFINTFHTNLLKIIYYSHIFHNVLSRSEKDTVKDYTYQSTYTKTLSNIDSHFDLYRDEYTDDKNKYTEILSVVGDILIKDIYDDYKLGILYKSLNGIIEFYIKGISKHIKFDYSELHKTNFSRVYTKEMHETPFSKTLNTYFDFKVNEKIAEEKEQMKIIKERFRKDSKSEKKRQDEEIAKFIKKGYKVKMISFGDFIDNYYERFRSLPSDEPIYPDKKKKEVIFYEIFGYESGGIKLTETEKILKYINYWIGKDGFDIGEKIVLKKEEYSTVVNIIKDGREINIADLGSGTNQVLALILKIISSDYPSEKLMLEEPEVNLHPNLQSKLADLIVDAYKLIHYFGEKHDIFDSTRRRKFIIETHSEYFIRRLQYLVAKKVIKPEDVAVYYFTNPNELKPGEEQIVNLRIREDGMTDRDFGTGFFDESTKLTMDLLKIQNFS